MQHYSETSFKINEVTNNEYATIYVALERGGFTYVTTMLL
jgi:hypothetical protein